MTTKCKVCESIYCQEIDTTIKNGITINALFLWCKDKGFKVSQNTLRNHAINHIEGFQFTEKIETDSNNATNEGFINFENYCDSIGLDPSYFNDIEKQLDHIVYGSQKALALAFFKNMALVDHKLTNLLAGKGSYPVAEIKGLRSIFEMYNRILSLDAYVDPNRAFKVIESLGYKIVDPTNPSWENEKS